MYLCDYHLFKEYIMYTNIGFQEISPGKIPTLKIPTHQTLPGKFPPGKLPPIKFPLILLIQFSVTHTNTSIFNVQFLRFYLHLLALFLTKDVSYKKKLAPLQLAVTLPQSHYIIAIVKFSNRSIQNLFNVESQCCIGSHKLNCLSSRNTLF